MIQHLSATHPCASKSDVRTSPLWPVPQLDGYLWAIEDLRSHIQTVQNMLNSLEQCRGTRVEQPDQGRVTNGRGGWGGRGGRGGRGGSTGGQRGTGRDVAVPCVPPTLLLPSPVQGFEVEIEKLRTRYTREHES